MKAEVLSIDRFMSFATIGVFATAIHYLILVAAVHIANADPLVASSVGFLISATLNYALNRRYTFGSRKPHSEAVTKFFAVATIGLALNGILLSAGLRAELNYVFAQVLATILVLLWNYFANAVWTFARR